MRTWTLLLIVFVFLVGCGPPPVSIPKPPAPPIEPTDPPSLPPDHPDEPLPPDDPRPQLTILHNRVRGEMGHGLLRMEQRLMKAAQKHADWMAATGKMAHVGANGSTVNSRIRQEGYQPALIGENVAMGYRTPEAAMVGWMNSPGHRANILKHEYEDVGIGVATARNGKLFWCVVFSKLRSGSSALGVEESHLPDGIEPKDADDQREVGEPGKQAEIDAVYDPPKVTGEPLVEPIRPDAALSTAVHRDASKEAKDYNFVVMMINDEIKKHYDPQKREAVIDNFLWRHAEHERAAESALNQFRRAGWSIEPIAQNAIDAAYKKFRFWRAADADDPVVPVARP